MELQRIFPQFGPELLAHLLNIGEVVNLDEGEMVMRTGQYFKNSLLVLEGQIKLYREGDDGEEFFLYFLEAGDACALSMICATKNEASMIKGKTVTKVKALAIPLKHMDDLMRNHQQWYYFVLENYRARFEELLTVIDQVAFHSMDEKLEFYLTRQFDVAKSNRITVTHQQIADDLNSSREVISRLLKKLEAGKKIEMQRHEIVRTGL